MPPGPVVSSASCPGPLGWEYGSFRPFYRAAEVQAYGGRHRISPARARERALEHHWVSTDSWRAVGFVGPR